MLTTCADVDGADFLPPAARVPPHGALVLVGPPVAAAHRTHDALALGRTDALADALTSRGALLAVEAVQKLAGIHAFERKKEGKRKKELILEGGRHNYEETQQCNR